LHLTTVVTTDLDSDGDLDVVASDGATHLFVWINDGAGHLTRKAPLPEKDEQPTTSTPSVNERPATALVSIQPAGALALWNDQRVWISLAGRAFRSRGRPDVASIAPGSLGSRAPPSLPLFA
ncbi:MAG TPA: VCBS repeat-containing protein, partial [Vicinamibacterales bacterium]|nr:VCBS repeat-containing protein [Vicinamibacterales bacterium]